MWPPTPWLRQTNCLGNPQVCFHRARAEATHPSHLAGPSRLAGPRPAQTCPYRRADGPRLDERLQPIDPNPGRAGPGSWWFAAGGLCGPWRRAGTLRALRPTGRLCRDGEASPFCALPRRPRGAPAAAVSACGPFSGAAAVRGPRPAWGRSRVRFHRRCRPVSKVAAWRARPAARVRPQALRCAKQGGPLRRGCRLRQRRCAPGSPNLQRPGRRGTTTRHVPVTVQRPARSHRSAAREACRWPAAPERAREAAKSYGPRGRPGRPRRRDSSGRRVATAT